MGIDDSETQMRMKAFEHVRKLSDLHGHLTETELKPGFIFEGERIPLVNLRRGIFKPKKMRYLLSIKTVFPSPNKRIWYDDQREAHRQIYQSEGAVEYSFMGRDPEAADGDSAYPSATSESPFLHFMKRWLKSMQR